MTMQKALWLPDIGEKYTLGEKEIAEPGPGEIRIRNHSVALNPMDWIFQKLGFFMIKKFPLVVGGEGAGFVDKLGEGVTNFVVGEKIFYKAIFNFEDDYGAYQEYTLVPARTVAKLPENITFEQAASICVGIAPFAAATYFPEPDGLGFTPPFERDGGLGKYKGQPILILGGASSVGQYAIQLSRLSGFSPIMTTASLHNEEYLGSLGATHVIDRHIPLSSAAFRDTVAQMIGSSPLTYVFDIFADAEGLQAVYDLLAPGGKLVLAHPQAVQENTESGKQVKRAWGSLDMSVGVRFMEGLPRWLADGTIKANMVEVLPGGLNAVEEGLRRLENGTVSAKKLVVHIDDTT